MRQKITWFIPGILLTLLLGLLWAMPAFAADAGEISFLSSKGGSGIDYVSLDGPAGDTGFYLEVADQDLNAPTEYTADGAGRVSVSDAQARTDWTNLADMNGDGTINADDVDIYDAAEGGEPIARTAGFSLDTINGRLTVGGGSFVEFHMNELTEISGRSATTVPSSEAARTGIADGGELVLPTGRTGPAQADDPEVEAPNLWDWMTILDANGDGRLTSRDGTVDGLVDDEGTNDVDESLVGDIKTSVIRASREDDTTIVDDASTTDVDESTLSEAGDFRLEVTITRGNDDDPETEDSNEFTADQVRITVNAVDRSSPLDNDATDAGDVQLTTATEVTVTYQVPVFAIGSSSNRVTLTSQAPNSTVSVILTESSAISGKFGVQVVLCESGMPGCAAGQAELDPAATDNIVDGKGIVTIPVIRAGDTISVTYADGSPSRTRRASIPLDVDGPSFNNMAPASGTAGREDEPTVSFTVADTDSGISDDKDADTSVYVLAGLYGLGEKNNDQTVTYVRDDLKLEEVTNGYAASVSIQEGDGDGALDADASGSEYEIRWWAVATDLAGNVSVSDSNGDTKCTVPASLDVGSLETGIVAAVGEVGEDGYVAGTGCDPHVVRVDAAGPDLDAPNTFTGTWHDGSEEKSGSDAIRTSIKVAFNEKLDCSSVSADDFTVDGAAPNGANCVGSNVYLDVDEIDPNDKPDIEVAAESLTDKAGNLIGDLDEITANDGIPAKLTVTVTGTAEGSRPITDKEITIMIESDERLQGNPSVVINKVGADYLLSSNQSVQATPTGIANQWSYPQAFNQPGDDGIDNVYVTGTDLGGTLSASAGTKGSKVMDSDPAEYTHDPDNESAILFEVDNEVQMPDWSPDIVDDGKTDNAGVFIRAEFSNEAKEYGLGHDAGEDEESSEDDTKPATDDPSKVKTDLDTSGTVTLVEASFNGEDVTADVITRDSVLFVYRPGGLTNGEHEFSITVEDAAGNEGTFELEFEKTDPAPYKLELNPGPNLVSFPADPADNSVDAVFGAEEISQVLTYDNGSGLWQTAAKGADGSFMGDLTTVSSMNGYWVVSDGVVDVSVILEPSGSIEIPPHISVQQGWNLIGVVDTDRSSAGTAVADYFANIDAEVVYGYDSLSGRLARQAADVDVETGMGYWVYANEAGIIIP